MKDPVQLYTNTDRDRVKIEANRYDSSKGRIIYRLPRKDSKHTEDSKDTFDHDGPVRALCSSDHSG
jgi:hypothetical protein